LLDRALPLPHAFQVNLVLDMVSVNRPVETRSGADAHAQLVAVAGNVAETSHRARRCVGPLAEERVPARLLKSEIRRGVFHKSTPTNKPVEVQAFPFL